MFLNQALTGREFSPQKLVGLSKTKLYPCAF